MSHLTYWIPRLFVAPSSVHTFVSNPANKSSQILAQRTWLSEAEVIWLSSFYSVVVLELLLNTDDDSHLLLTPKAQNATSATSNAPT